MRLILRHDQTSATLIRLMAYLGGLGLLAIGAGLLFQFPSLLQACF
jgi:hypothetical protein